jgi:hypothetical protein
VPTVTLFIATWQRGHREASAPVASLRFPFAPQCEQNFAPANITPKHVGQVTVASVALQKSQQVAADETAAPQEGQRSVSAGMAAQIEIRSIIGSTMLFVHRADTPVFSCINVRHS